MSIYIHASTSPGEILLSSPRSQSEFPERLSAITSDKVLCCCMKICQDMRVFTRFLRVSFDMVNTCAWGNRKSDSRYHKRIFGVMFIPVSYRNLNWNACVRQRWQSKTDFLMFVCFKVAHSVSFENFYLVMFYGNQIIWTVKIRTSKSTRSKGKQQARNKSTLSAGFQWTVHNTRWYHEASSI
jgi:hypothetical protein